MHAGIYYKPGSDRARLCRPGLFKMFDFCRENGVHFEKCGKLIIATDSSEIPRLKDLMARGIENGVPDLRFIESGREIREIEPAAAGVAAIHSPHTAIVSFPAVVSALLLQLSNRSVRLLPSFHLSHCYENSPADKLGPLLLSDLSFSNLLFARAR